MIIINSSLLRFTLFASCLTAICTTTYAAQEEISQHAQWQLEQTEGGVKVYSRPVEGSPYLEVKATVLIEAPTKKLSELMGDGNGCVEWRTTCKTSKVIESISADERFVHMVLDLPWPVSDRDLVLHTVTTIDTQDRSATVSLKSASERYPVKDHVRAESSGQFMIREVSENQSEFTYIMHVDLGGSLPAKSVNSGLADATMDDLTQLKRLAEN